MIKVPGDANQLNTNGCAFFPEYIMSKRKKEPSFTSVLLKYLCVCLIKLIT